MLAMTSDQKSRQCNPPSPPSLYPPQGKRMDPKYVDKEYIIKFIQYSTG